VLGLKHPGTLMSIYCLARLLAKQCRYDESTALYDRACVAYDAVLEGHHPTTRACRYHLSRALNLQKQSCVLITPASAENNTASEWHSVAASDLGVSSIEKILVSTPQAVGTPPSPLRLSRKTTVMLTEATCNASSASNEKLQTDSTNYIY
jgi:hypothetical protein